MGQITTRIPYKVNRIVFKDGTEINDKQVFILGNFLIVEGYDPDNNNAWYNIDEIKRLVGVMPSEDLNNKQMRIGIF